MAEVKITCPNCFKGDQCFEETLWTLNLICVLIVDSQVIHIHKRFRRFKKSRGFINRTDERDKFI